HRAGIMTLDLALAHMLETTLMFAATSGKQFDMVFLRVLKKHAGFREKVPVIKVAQRLEPYKDDIVQMADMICGAVCNDDPQYFKLISQRQGGRVIYPAVEVK